MKFAPDYVACVLNDVFEDAKAQFLSPLMAIHHAHLVMLVEQGIVSPADGRALAAALDSIDLDAVRQVQYDGTYEDLFFYVERLIVAQCGEDVAGRLHTARSRNDIDMTMYRMRQREMVLALTDGTLGAAQDAARPRGAAHRGRLSRAHAYAAGAADDDRALPDGGRRAAGARHRQAARGLRGDQPGIRSAPARSPARAFPSIAAGRRRCLVSMARPATPTAASPRSITCSRACRPRPCCSWAWAGSFRTCCCGARPRSATCACRTDSSSAAASCRRSAIPWRSSTPGRSPARRSGSRAAVVLAVHNTPFGDIVDTEDDLQPLVSSMFRDGARAIRLVTAAMSGAEFNTARMAERAAAGWITVTELADTLAREHGVPFRSAHGIAARLVSRAGKRGTVGTVGGLARGVAGSAGKERRHGRRRTGARAEPPAFRRRAKDARRSGTERNRARDRRITAAPGRGRRVAEIADREACAARSVELEEAVVKRFEALEHSNPLTRAADPRPSPEPRAPSSDRFQIATTQCCPGSMGSSSSSRSTSAGPYWLRK